MYFVGVKLQFLLEMFYQLIKLLRVQQFAILNRQLEIKDLIQDAQEPMQQLLDTLMMEQEPELDFHQVQEKLFLEAVEPLLELLLVEEEMKSQS
jgi:hypothetical protein